MNYPHNLAKRIICLTISSLVFSAQAQSFTEPAQDELVLGCGSRNTTPGHACRVNSRFVYKIRFYCEPNNGLTRNLVIDSPVTPFDEHLTYNPDTKELTSTASHTYGQTTADCDRELVAACGHANAYAQRVASFWSQYLTETLSGQRCVENDGIAIVIPTRVKVPSACP